MSTLKELRWGYPPSPNVGPLRLLLALSLRGASRLLSRLAADLVSAPAAPKRSDPRLEFHAEAGAPEGALYVDGQLVG